MEEDRGIKPPRYYQGRPEVPKRETPLKFTSPTPDRIDDDAAAYIADDRLADAVNAALILGQPLLVTGEPGTGKTQLAYSMERELGYKVRKFDTKSTSAYRELLYTYDALRHFQDAHRGEAKPVKEYITYNELGTAILLTQPKERYQGYLPESFVHPGQRRSIVLIDEIDKAPRDFPNDLLNELEGMYFNVPELDMGNDRIEANKELHPIIIITSNSEKSLPDPFLRRCLYYHIPFPNRDCLVEILLSHNPSPGGGTPAWLDDAMNFFIKLRGLGDELDKRPATAELLNWINYLRLLEFEDAERLAARREPVLSSLIALCKSEADRERAESLLITCLDAVLR
jgi:MoxR-like ATPase